MFTQHSFPPVVCFHAHSFAALPNGAAALASSPLLSPLAVFAVGGILAALLRHLYVRSQIAGWVANDGAAAYLPRITDSWDVAALAGAVACIAVLFAGAGVPVALQLTNAAAVEEDADVSAVSGKLLRSPAKGSSSLQTSSSSAAAAVAGTGYVSAGEMAAAAAAAYDVSRGSSSKPSGGSILTTASSLSASASYLAAANALSSSSSSSSGAGVSRNGGSAAADDGGDADASIARKRSARRRA